jgi:hypothetical protein
VKIELFHQMLRFSPFWMSVDLLALGHFFFSWNQTRRKTGWKIDFWHSTLFIALVLPLLLMYPFSASIYNVVATGTGYESLEPFVDRAFAISLLGYFFFWIGRILYDKWEKQIPLFSLCLFFQPLENLVKRNIRTKRLVDFLFFLTLFLCGVISVIAYLKGYFLHPRDYFLKNGFLRPFFNLTLTLLSFSILFLNLRWLQFKDSLLKSLILLLISLSFGLRGVTITALLSLMLYYSFSKEGKVSLLKMGFGLFTLTILLLYMNQIRQGIFSPSLMAKTFFLSLFYGNHFCDTRDFAWTLAGWNEIYLYGKTYFAGILSFVPRFLSSFREEWSYFLYTNALLGFDSAQHAGLRPTLFGEAFFNFSYYGVILLGTVGGYFLRAADVKLKRAIHAHKDIVEGYSGTLLYSFISSFFITTGLWGFYLFILFNGALSLLIFPKRMTFTGQKIPSD